MEFSLDLNSSRAQRSRLRNSLANKPIQALLVVCAFGFISFGAALLLVGEAIGWAVMAPAIPFIMVRAWFKGSLEEIPASSHSTGSLVLLHELLDAELLAKLPRNTELSAFDIWNGLKEVEEHYFIHNRYGVDESFFDAFVSKEPGSARIIWQEVARLQQAKSFSDYSNIAVLVSLISSVPNADQLLRSGGVELNDVLTAIDWMHDIKAKRERAKSIKNFGGIGRDWAYGYTPILRNLGRNITESIEAHGFFSDTSMHHQIVDQMVQIMGSSNATVTLVGDEGAGKTTCVYAFAETILGDPNVPKKIRYNQVVQLDATTLLANAKRPGELEDLMLHILNEAHHAKNIILFFDEAQVFFGAQGGIDISNVLMPALESSSVRLIFAMNPQQWQRLSGSGITARLTPVTVQPADETNTLAVLRDQVGGFEYRHKVTFTYDALKEAYKLGSRYVTTQVMPGAALQVLQQAATTTQQKLVTKNEIQQSVEQTYGIKLQTASASETNNLLHLEDQLHSQVISQDRAISVIANALRRSRSGVGNPDRPIGTFLFLGPTGVGKTELSKALARSYFGNENALIRVDMNQFVNADDVSRLISPLSSSELGFLGEVRKNPFSVILFDEIEKAHPSVVNALLQMLDEGIMRDNENRNVSFRDAIIIATSNAGADDIRQLIEQGKNIAELESTFIDTLIAKGSFAPEFVNRFDEVVLFKPLDQTDLLQVIDLIIGGINNTLSSQQVSVNLTQEAKQWLVAKGYDSKLGARPMRRMAQRYVENIIAKRLLERSVQPGGTIQLDVPDFEAAN